MRFQAPRGTEDVLPGSSTQWLALEQIFREVTARFGYREIRTPTFEDTNLFARTAGETSDIVDKEMYTFEDKGGRSCTLKPEGTAPVMRAVVEHSLCPPGAHLRLSYVTPCFRYGRPQKGRLRELHQLGFELIGSESVGADAEVLELVYRVFAAVGLADVTLRINSIGREECRSRYRDVILRHTESFRLGLSDEVRARAEKNPLGMLDAKDEGTQSALHGLPPILDFLEETSRSRFDRVQQLLTEAAVPFEVDSRIVRGLDYYTETVFEVAGEIGSSLCGGGRYDGLIQEIGGAATPSVGVGFGIERLLLEREMRGLRFTDPAPAVFVAILGDEAAQAGASLARELRAAGHEVHLDLDRRSVKSQMRQADKSGAKFVAIIGEEEARQGTVQWKNLQDGSQAMIPLTEARQRLGS